ncbi:hypothetical protein EBM89_07010 [Cellulomonas triticagri]|uniref:Uncharacterized protein n=1 Tax=Cellulomonas triticagri TaxID=2483352 RepID=A0A3M2JIE1_9CELL|nr:hypothetical protein EBM89_07010 [Cellulomonas triticagri]
MGTRLDHAEALVLPDDLTAGLDALPGAREHGDRVRRGARQAVPRRVAARVATRHAGGAGRGASADGPAGIPSRRDGDPGEAAAQPSSPR